MKTIKTIRYILFALMVLGGFANFAQNNYGIQILYDCHLFVAFTFFIEACVVLKKEFREGKLKAITRFFEYLFIGLIFLGFYFKFRHVFGASPLILLGFIFLALQYLIFTLNRLFRDFRKGKLLALMVFLFMVPAMTSVTWIVFKNMHWRGSFMLAWVSIISMLLFLLIAFIKKRFYFEGETISLFTRLAQLPGKKVLVAAYFTIWVVHFLLVVYNMAPNFYTLSNPSKVEELLEKKEAERVDEYMNNYYTFFENRQAEDR